jgi:hypothetical protein
VHFSAVVKTEHAMSMWLCENDNCVQKCIFLACVHTCICRPLKKKFILRSRCKTQRKSDEKINEN